MKTIKKSILPSVLLIFGIIPFLLPFIFGLYRMSIESWELFDFVVLYSFVYWPTYVAGLICITGYVILCVRRKGIKSSKR